MFVRNPMILPPLLDRVTGFFARLADRIAGFGDRAGGDRLACDPLACDRAGLDPGHAGALLARLRHLAARFRAVAATPIPPPRPEPKPAEPRFIPTHRFRELSPDSPPEPMRRPCSWRWLTQLVPQAAAERAQLEDLLRDPAMAERLAADPRLGRLLRPLGWMLGVERALLPPSRWRRRQVVVVPGAHAALAAAVEEYAAGRAQGEAAAEVLARCCVWVPARPDPRWDRRQESRRARQRERQRERPARQWLVWRGCAGPVLPGLAEFSA